MQAWDDLKGPETELIEKVLRKKFPKTDAYRYNPASIRVRVVDKKFKGKSIPEREDRVLPLIRQLPEDIQADIMVLLMLTPDETAESLMNLEFEKPTPSML